jgi:hypothetical protein
MVQRHNHHDCAAQKIDGLQASGLGECGHGARSLAKCRARTAD